MRVFLFVSILILLIAQSQSAQVKSENSSVEVLGLKWSKSRQKVENPEKQPSTTPTAQSALSPANRNFQRNRRINDPVGAPDPNEGTLEARSADLEKIVQESRTSKSKVVDGFMYQAEIRNASPSTIEVLFWEYQFKERANPANVVSHQFLCTVNIKPEKKQELRVFSTHSPGNLVSAGSLDNKSGNLFEEKILINRIENADGTIWQRTGWSFTDMKLSIARAIETPWGSEMCRKL